MTTITDTSILNWLPLDESGGEIWRLALINSENQNWNVTDPTNSTTTLAMTAAAKHGTGSSLFASPAHLGLATGLLLSLLLNSRIWTTKANREVFGTGFGAPKPYQWILHLTPSSSFTFASTKTFILPYLYFLPLLAIVLLLPILSLLMAFLLPFAVYRFVIQKYLQYRDEGQHKKKLFSGADAVWTFNESYQSYSVINALIVLEGEPQIEKLRNILTVQLGSIPKLRMRHNFTLGYATWYEDREMDLGSLVQWIPGFSSNSQSDSNMAGTRGINQPHNKNISHTKWNRQNLSKIVESLCNRPLPKNHTVGWEALVGKAMPWDESDNDVNADRVEDKHNHKCIKDETTSQIVFPVLFRIHHSVGDGASLLQLLMSALIDDEIPNSPTSINGPHLEYLTSLSRPLTLNISPVEVDHNETDTSNSDKTHVPPAKISEKPKSSSYIKTQVFQNRDFVTCNPLENLEISSGTKTIKSYSQFCNSTSNSSAASNLDKESSFLYGRRLSGRKTILWDSTSVTVEEIKQIRGATGVKFTEILLSAVSAALSNYWEAREKGQLNDVTCAKRKCSQMMQNGQKSGKTSGLATESKNNGDQLTDVPKENEEESQNKENILLIGCNKQASPPPSVKLVLPAIIGSIFKKQKILTLKDTSELENLFSVAVMSLPVGKSGGCPLQRLSKVSDASGYMMPLRKDSIVDCGMKMKLDKETFTHQVSENAREINKCTPKANQELGNILSSMKVHPDIKSQETTHENSTGKENLKEASITPSEPEILTYYYTNQPEVQLILAQEPEPVTSRSAQVHYHRYSDSAKVILHEKEPYHCPTTIFFTQNNSSCDTNDEDNSRVNEANTKSSHNVETRNEDTDFKCSYIEHSNASILIKTGSQCFEKEEICSTTSEQAKTQEAPKSNSVPPASINFPSSPTIQHLLTRWLALDIVATVLPSVFAAPMMKVAAKDVAVVMSNLPGPPTKLHSILGGHALKDIVFWAPHRGYTGLGITILSYDGLLHIGVMADDAVIPTQKGAQLIMNAILDELHSLKAAVSSSH